MNQIPDSSLFLSLSLLQQALHPIWINKISTDIRLHYAVLFKPFSQIIVATKRGEHPPSGVQEVLRITLVPLRLIGPVVQGGVREILVSKVISSPRNTQNIFVEKPVEPKGLARKKSKHTPGLCLTVDAMRSCSLGPLRLF